MAGTELEMPHGSDKDAPPPGKIDTEFDEHDPPDDQDDQDDLVLTPGGRRPRSKTARVEPGQHAAVKDGRLTVIDNATGRVVTDLGPVKGPRGDDTEEDPSADVSEPQRHGGPMKRAEHPHQGG
jgi:hypothetical protein